MQKEEIISSGILEMYVMGLTSAQENLQVQQWVALFPEVKNELSRIEEDLEAYAATNKIIPDANVKKRIIHNIFPAAGDGKQKPTARVVNMLPFWKRLAAASVTLLLLSSLINLLFYNKYEKERKLASETQQQLLAKESLASETQQQLLAKETENRTMKEEMSVVHNKYSMPVALQGMPDAPDAAEIGRASCRERVCYAV